jgi:hypothetical protein
VKADSFFKKHTVSFKQLPKKRVAYIAAGLVVGAGLFYSLVFFISKPIQFSYAGDSCARHLLLFPNIQQQSGSDDFTVTKEGVVKVGGLSLASTQLCVEPATSPSIGETRLTVSPWGGPLFAKPFAIEVSKAPIVAVSSIKGAKIPANQPFKIPLNEGDTIHTYTVAVGEATAPCSPEAAAVVCDIPALKLEHGTPYSLVISRTFPGETERDIVGTVAIATLDPMVITQSSLTADQVVYDTPQSFTFEAGRKVKAVEATLAVKKDGVEQMPVSLKAAVTDTKFSLNLAKALERKTTYVLTLKQVQGDDGGTLPSPVAYTFSTSGGPKVSGVSVGTTKVGQNERIVLTFDQPLHTSVNVGQFIRTTGVNTGVSKLSDTQVAVTVQNAPLCAAFSIVVDKGMRSGSNDAIADEAWKFDTRTICGYSSVIGSSVRGRPIVAHYFGNGATTILFTGGIHGSEPSSTTTMQAWVDYLYANGYKIPADKRVVVVPNTNPDGIASGSRNNVNNVNLGRNFPTSNWKADIETASGLLVNGGGKGAGSEPETAALIKLTRQLRPRLEVSFHAQGSLVGANKFSDSVAIGDIYAKLVGYKTMFYNAEAVMGYPMTGEYEDWMGEEMNIPAILIELPRTSGNYLTSQLDALVRMLSV